MYLAINRSSLAVRVRVLRAAPWLQRWIRNSSRASAAGPSRWRFKTRGYLNNFSNMSDLLFKVGIRPVSTTNLCGAQRRFLHQNSGVANPAPHICGDHITHRAPQMTLAKTKHQSDHGV